jgi:hypothetical protein
MAVWLKVEVAESGGSGSAAGGKPAVKLLPRGREGNSWDEGGGWAESGRGGAAGGWGRSGGADRGCGSAGWGEHGGWSGGADGWSSSGRWGDSASDHGPPHGRHTWREEQDREKAPERQRGGRRHSRERKKAQGSGVVGSNKKYSQEQKHKWAQKAAERCGSQWEQGRQEGQADDQGEATEAADKVDGQAADSSGGGSPSGETPAKQHRGSVAALLPQKEKSRPPLPPAARPAGVAAPQTPPTPPKSLSQQAQRSDPSRVEALLQKIVEAVSADQGSAPAGSAAGAARSSGAAVPAAPTWPGAGSGGAVPPSFAPGWGWPSPCWPSGISMQPMALTMPMGHSMPMGQSMPMAQSMPLAHQIGFPVPQQFLTVPAANHGQVIPKQGAGRAGGRWDAVSLQRRLLEQANARGRF